MYKVKGDNATCAYNESMEYAPVLIEISDNIKKLHDPDGGKYNYLLQVWDKFGKKVFQERLIKRVNKWAICFDFFIFKTNAPDENSDYFQIYNLRNNSITMVKDFLNDDSYKFFAYNNGKLFAANDKTIKVVAVKMVTKRGISVKREINQANVASIELTQPSEEVEEEEDEKENASGLLDESVAES